MCLHKPVLLEKSVDIMSVFDGVYVDLTTGMGGHSAEILKRLNKGVLICVDKDPNALEIAEKKLVPQKKEGVDIIYINSDYSGIEKISQQYGKFNGVLADLGVSSYQIDTAERGFSYRFNAPLDMRMDTNGNKKAADLFALEEGFIADVLYNYGEIRSSKKLASMLKSASPSTTGDVAKIVNEFNRSKDDKRLLSMVFQAIRIWVNDELASLKNMVENLKETMNTGAVAAIIAYHSLEDRIVKEEIKKGMTQANPDGTKNYNFLPYFQKITAKPIVPDKKEIIENPRSRSAKLRGFKRI